MGCAWASDHRTLSGMTDIPALRPPHETPAIETLRHLTEHWRALMGPLGFSHHRLWVLMLDSDGRLIPNVLTIDEIPARADPVGCRSLMSIVDHALPHDGSLAILLSRAGRHPMNADDRSWARQLIDAADHQDLRLWPVHFANDAQLRVFAPDDL